ncbi:MAG: hypothetical protein HOQ27_11115, partial [Dermatophilaceae bacterium]|nr:hypothetical protein [Dermatophilaceae bacterium]
MKNATRKQALGVMAYVEGWLSNDFPDASHYLLTHMDKIADAMVDDEC